MRCQICNRKINTVCEDCDLEVPVENGRFMADWRQACDRCYDEYDRGLRVQTGEVQPNAHPE